MNHDDIFTELNILIHKLESIMDIMFESTKEIIDTGNVNYELKYIIDKLDMIIDSMDNSKVISMLESAKYDITYASTDIIDNADIFDKIKKLKHAKGTLIDFKAKLNTH